MLKPGSILLRNLLILLTILGVLPVAIIGAWGINSAIDQERQQLERSMLNLSRALATAVDAELDSVVSAMRALSFNPLLDDGDLPAFYKVAGDAAKARPHWVGINLNDGQGRLIFKTVLPFGSAEAKVVEPDSMERAIATGKPVAGRITKGQRSGYAVPVRFPVVRDGTVAYVLTVAVTPDRILDIIKRQQVPDKWVISIHDASQLRVARSLDHDKTIATGPSPSLARMLQSGQPEAAGTTHTLEGTEVVTTYVRSPQYGWIVAIGAPTAPLREVLLQRLALHAGVIVLSLAVCVAFANYLSRRIAEGINRLGRQAALLGQGKPVRHEPHPIREVNQIGLALEAASIERTAVEREREALLHARNEALARAEQAMRAKDEFLAVLGHELRNPLAPMVTALDVMEMKGDASHLRVRGIMRRQVAHMKRLVDDLLDISRITSGKLAIIREPVNLRIVLEQAIEAAESQNDGSTPQVEVSGVEDVWVSGDETRLVQALTNLLINAFRFDPSGLIAVRMQAGAGTVHLSVEDHGVGLAPEVAEQIFKPFFQARQPIARSAGGLGLGLAIVRSIIELHGGAVSAHSGGPGRGSRFEMRLPTMPAPPAQQSEHRPPAQVVRAARILLVDDNRDAAQTIKDMLELSGHTVDLAHDGYEAMRLIPVFWPEVVILDIGLPDMDGFALARTIRERFPTWNGRLIALTGYGQEGDKTRAAEAGFDLHLTKPVETARLLRAVDMEMKLDRGA